MDTERVRVGLSAELDSLGIGHGVETVHGAHADGVLVRSPYSEPLTVVEDSGRFALVARGVDGQAKVIDTELSATGSLELLGLYLAFHSLWAMKRLVDRDGAEAVARRMPALLTHQQLALAFIATAIGSTDPAVREYATGLMASATRMLKRER